MSAVKLAADGLRDLDISEVRPESDIVPDAPRRTPRILLAEDDYEMRSVLASMLRKQGYEVIEANSGLRLLEQMSLSLVYDVKFDLDLVVSDIRMPEMTGLDAVASFQKYDNAPPVILITAFGDRATHAAAERLGVTAVFDKPFDIDEFRAFVEAVVPPPGTGR